MHRQKNAQAIAAKYCGNKHMAIKNAIVSEPSVIPFK